MSVHPACSALDERIARLRQLAHADTRLEGVLLYGSWTLGEADAHSDIEAYLYIQDDHLADFDGPAFLAELAPLQLAYTNMYGILAVIFDDLMRGEFHLTAAGPGIDEVPTWQGMVHLPRPDDAVLLDRTGRLTRAARQLAAFRPPEPVATAQQLTDELTNWTLMLAHVLARGEVARAHALLHTVIAPQQLQLCRLLRDSTAHWLTPSRALEQDLPTIDRHRYASTTAAARDQDVHTAAHNSWCWSRDLATEAADRWPIHLPHPLHEQISSLLNDRR
ncbi:nucleotidyltransferase domain-containing protein [Streptomyces sp. Isolate_219]|uniref:nucleotidyltransferase domain-containing protein n=1 Tax=Streptomyces sp. Isolate_219 TaxID=2950110 RepID=UPI0021C5D723|nr:nucleotidyltransferase domain-containing protein [Streptomyces sp. Isolate_219]MCR8573136.1 nucleotidyltransferase domain-containing protein [Streptomyces sp. Isolate_219]